MKTRNSIHIVAVAGLSVWCALSAFGQQGFTSGSDGSFGAINVTAGSTNEMPLPFDGIIHATTVTVAAGGTLRLVPNANNTPAFLLAQGEVEIDGIVDVSATHAAGLVPGVPGPGGGAGGHFGDAAMPGGPGGNPGGGNGGTTSAGNGSHRTSAFGGPGGPLYGSPLQIPPSGGGGGGGWNGRYGGPGGGAILIASTAAIHLKPSASILATGGNTGAGGDWSGGGAGGGVRLVAPLITAEAGSQINVMGSVGTGVRGDGPAGYVRIDGFQKVGMNFLTIAPGGSATYGSLMLALPDPLPGLSIVEAAGQTIPAGSQPVSFVLSQGSDPETTVRVSAKDFNATLPVRLELVPDHGSKQVYNGTIDNRAANPAEFVFDVTLPVNTRVTLHAFGGGDLPPP